MEILWSMVAFLGLAVEAVFAYFAALGFPMLI